MKAQSRSPTSLRPASSSSEVVRPIRQHARSHMKTEVCGVLIGEMKDDAVQIDECIAGKDAAQAGTHVTFTQDTWEHIYKVKDAEFPNQRIVGWYHSHPGFGVFLSEHDTFIHKNFFSSPGQVAWVYDPHSDEEGCFGWAGDRIERLGLISITDPHGGEECSETHGAQETAAQDDEESESDLPRQIEVKEKVFAALGRFPALSPSGYSAGTADCLVHLPASGGDSRRSDNRQATARSAHRDQSKESAAGSRCKCATRRRAGRRPASARQSKQGGQCPVQMTIRSRSPWKIWTR